MAWAPSLLTQRTVYSGQPEDNRGDIGVKETSKTKVLVFANMLSKFQAKRLINDKVTVSDILGSKSTILTDFHL